MADPTTDPPTDPPADPADVVSQIGALLVADQLDTTAKRATKQQTGAALAVAQHADDTAGANVTQAEGKQNADLDAGIALLNTTFRIGPVPASRPLRN